jgi:4-hydroxy-tetrahydrodipicolinate synthase
VYTHIVGPRVRELVSRFEDGDLEGAREIEKELAPIIEALSVANPIPVKAALNMLGHDVGGHRLPLVEATEAEKTALRGALERAGILAGARA